MTVWKQIIGWPYEVSETGMVRSQRSKRILKPMRCCQKKKQYSTVRLCNKGKYKDRRVHQLVLEAFVGSRPNGFFGLHKDDNTWNNNLSNLAWGTPKDNVWDCAHKRRRLSKIQAADIVIRMLHGEKGRKLAVEYGVSEQTICDIYKGRSVIYEVG